MTKKITIKSLLVIAAASLGAIVGHAQTSADGSTRMQERYGQLGSRHLGVDYGYAHLDDTAFDDLNGFGLRYNQPVGAGIDFSLGYDWAESNLVAGSRAKAEEATASLTWYTEANGTRPFIEPGVGWTWAKVGRFKTDSFLYYIGAGVELQVARAWVITPYVRFADATEFDGNTWNFGVKSAYRLSESWGLNVELSADDDSNTGFKLGVNYHF